MSGGGCLNVTKVFPDSPDASYMTMVALELAVYFFDERGTSWSLAQFRRECIALFGAPTGAKCEIHHLLAQFFVTGIEAHRAGDEYRETYANLMNCPYLGIPITTDEHRGPDSVHGLFIDAAINARVDLSDGFYMGLSKLAPHEYLEISLEAFRISHPGMYAVWAQIVLRAYNAL